MGFYGRRLIPNPLLKELLDKRYTHYVTLSFNNQAFIVEIKNGSKADLTSNDIKAFISSLPDGAIYPVHQVGLTDKEAIAFIFVNGIKNDSGTNKIIVSELSYAISSEEVVIYGNQESSVLGDYTIVSQYVL